MTHSEISKAQSEVYEAAKAGSPEAIRRYNELCQARAELMSRPKRQAKATHWFYAQPGFCGSK